MHREDTDDILFSIRNILDNSHMTKRESFAMAAMQGLSMRVTSLFDHEVAADAVRLADATLRELNKAAP